MAAAAFKQLYKGAKRRLFDIPRPRPGEDEGWRPFLVPEYRDSDEQIGFTLPPQYKKYFTGAIRVVWKYGYIPQWDNPDDPRMDHYWDDEIRVYWVNRHPPTRTPPSEVEAAWTGSIADAIRRFLESTESQVWLGQIGSNLRSRGAIASNAVAHIAEEERRTAAAGAAERAAANARAENTVRSQVENQARAQAQPNTRRRKNRRKYRKTRRN